MGTKLNVVKEAITPPIAENNIDTVKNLETTRIHKKKR